MIYISVSYTHLDVYKRQVDDGSEEQLEDAEEVQCHDVELDYVDEEGETVEKRK